MPLRAGSTARHEIACPTCTRADASSAARLGSADRSAGGVRRARTRARRVSHVVGRRAAARAARCCAAGAARTLSGQPYGRCFMLLSSVRWRVGRVADGARALEHPSVVLDDLAMCRRLRCRARSFGCERGCWVRCAAVPGGARRSCTGQARPPHALCLEADHAGPAAGPVQSA